MQDQSQKSALNFCLVQRPERVGWPIHGQFAFFSPERVRISHLCFSLAAAQDMLALWIAQDSIDADTAAENERQVRESGLPPDLTRWDRIVRSFSDETVYPVLISRFCGTFPQALDAPARFQLCCHSEQCDLDNCQNYPPHGKLHLEGMNNPFGELLFTPQAAEASFGQGLEAGVFTADDERKIRETANAQLTDDESAQRADRLVVFASRNMTETGFLGEELDHVFGLQQPEKPARFEPCSGDHFHLHIRDDRTFGVGLYTAYDARITLDGAQDAGLLAQSDHDRLAATIDALGLPPGSPEESQIAIPQEDDPAIFKLVQFLMAYIAGPSQD